MPPRMQEFSRGRGSTRIFAPEGRRVVATGEAQPAAGRAERNPWNTASSFKSVPEGRRNKTIRLIEYVPFVEIDFMNTE